MNAWNQIKFITTLSGVIIFINISVICFAGSQVNKQQVIKDTPRKLIKDGTKKNEVNIVSNPLIIPCPQNMKIKSGSFLLGNNISIKYVTDKAPAPKDKNTLDIFKQILADKTRRNFTIETANKFELKKKTIYLINSKQLDKSASKIISGFKQYAEIQGKTEGYLLTIDKNNIVLIANDSKGLLNGIFTLKQLYTDNGFKSLEIIDFPDFKFRGFHIITRMKSIGFYIRWIELLAELKYNAAIFMFAGNLEFKTNPDAYLHNAYFTQKKFLKVYDACKKYQIEFIPQINVLGKANWADGKKNVWLINNEKKYKDIFEPRDKNNPSPHQKRVFKAAKPEVYALLTPLLDEIIDLFHPKYIHLGFDEANELGKSEESKGRGTPAELLVQHLNYFDNHLKSRNVKTIVWQDMLFGPRAKRTGTSTSVHNIAKDIIIMPWHYITPWTLRKWKEKGVRGVPLEYNSFDFFHKLGFKTIGAPWYDKQNHMILAENVKRVEGLGLCGTSWSIHMASKAIINRMKKARGKKQILAKREPAAFWYISEVTWNKDKYYENLDKYDPVDLFNKRFKDMNIFTEYQVNEY